MTIDERIEKLTERHEALTQSIELMVLENRERFGFIAESLATLSNVAQPHQHRLDSHENRLDTLEGEV